MLLLSWRTILRGSFYFGSTRPKKAWGPGCKIVDFPRLSVAYLVDLVKPDYTCQDGKFFGASRGDIGVIRKVKWFPFSKTPNLTPKVWAIIQPGDAVDDTATKAGVWNQLLCQVLVSTLPCEFDATNGFLSSSSTTYAFIFFSLELLNPDITPVSQIEGEYKFGMVTQPADNGRWPSRHLHLYDRWLKP
jgi:hypothetical protein